MKTFSRTFVLAAIVATAAGTPACAQSPKGDKASSSAKSDPSALESLGQIAKTYKNLSTYSDHGQLVLEVISGGQKHVEKNRLHVTFARPNKIDLDSDLVQLRCDGKSMQTSVVPLKRFIVTDAPKTLTLGSFEEGPVAAVLFGGVGFQSTILLKLLFEDDAQKALLKMSEGVVKSADDVKVGEKTLKAIVLPLNGPDFKIIFDPETKLLNRIETIFSKEELEALIATSEDAKDIKMYWESGKVSTEAPKSDAFTLIPPKGFEKIASLEDLIPAGQADAGDDDFSKSLVGKPAPDFSLTVLDGPGKTKPIKKSDLAGKVVVIDFWATWCGPCLLELPEIQKLISGYVKDKKAVVVVALSQDTMPAELLEVRKLVEKTIKDNNLNLLQPPVGLVALDPQNVVGGAFKPPGYPSLVVIDAKGIVQTAHVGFGGDTIEKLAGEIDTLLAGESLLPKEKKDAKEAGGKPAEKK